MKNEFWKQNRSRLYLIAAATAVICLVIMVFFKLEVFSAGFEFTVSIFKPFLFGFVISYLLRPVAVRIERLLRRLFRKNKKTDPQGGALRVISAFIAILLMFVALVVILLLILPQLVVSISSIISSLPDAVERFQKSLTSLVQGGSDNMLIVAINESVSTLTGKLENFLSTSMLPTLESAVTGVTSSFMNLLGFLGNFGLGCIISIYFLCSWEKFVAQARLLTYSIFPEKAADWIKSEMIMADRIFSGFIVGKILDSAIVGVLCFLVCVIFRIPYAALVSVIVGITNIIPFFGPYIGIIPSTLLILTVSPLKALFFLIVVFVLEQIDGNVLGPKILGDRLGLPSFWILFSILVFSSLWGFLGMLIGAPVFALLYDLIRKSIVTGLKARGQEKMLESYSRKFGEDPPEKQETDTTGYDRTHNNK